MVSSKKEDKLAAFLREVSNWSWDAFVKAEHNEEFSANQSIIFALIRACVMQKLDAIRIAVNRLDGKLKTPVRIEYPKIYYLYPNAQNKQAHLGDELVRSDGSDVSIIPPRNDDASAEPEPDLPSLSFRQTLAKMSDYPRNLPQAIIDLALQTEQWLRNQADLPPEIPKVKSVVAAHLLVLAQKRNIDAITEVFDAIDGKLTETLQVLGDDIFITDYSTVAPDGALPNKDGVLQIEATQAQDQWARKLGKEG